MLLIRLGWSSWTLTVVLLTRESIVLHTLHIKCIFQVKYIFKGNGIVSIPKSFTYRPFFIVLQKGSDNNSTGKPFEFPSDLANADEAQIKVSSHKNMVNTYRLIYWINCMFPCYCDLKTLGHIIKQHFREILC